MGIIKKIINRFYGLRMRLSKLTGIGININSNHNMVKPPESFFNLNATGSNGKTVSFEDFRGKKIMIVNLASRCGYTPQYAELEELYQANKNSLVILGFPSNDFGGQEPGNDEEIENFCRVNFGVTFPLFHKDKVSGPGKQPVYQWLTDPARNGWNSQEPSWNFYKYLVDADGRLDKIFSSSVSPADIIPA
jgi:glutathione peroxidase